MCLKSIIEERFKNNGRYICVCISVIVFLTGFLAYFIFMQTGLGNGDSIVEGQWYYHNENWHLSLGRWAVRYLNCLIGSNLVLPHLIIFVYCLVVIASAVMMKRLLKLSSLLFTGLSAAIMIVNPTVIEQLAYRHVALSMAFSLLLSLIFVVCAADSRLWVNALGMLCMAIMLGLYQSYISVIAVVSLEYIIVKLTSPYNSGEQTEDKNICVKESLFFFLRSIIMGVLGCVLYFGILHIEMNRYDVSAADRLSSVAITDVLANLPQNINDAYKQFYVFFRDEMLGRNYFYIILFVLTLIAIVIDVCLMIKKRKWGQLSLWTVCGLLLPIGAYLVAIILNYSPLSTPMKYQYFMIIPLMLKLIETGTVGVKNNVKLKLFSNVIFYVSGVMVAFILSTFIINANATARSYELSYNAIKTQYEIMLAKVYGLDGYEMDKTPIMPIGVVDDTAVRRTQSNVYQYAIGIPESVYSWGGFQNLKETRYYYFTSFLGVDPKFNPDEVMGEVYQEIINSKDYEGMPIWPAKGSVAMINGVAVVKMTDNPPQIED